MVIHTLQFIKLYFLQLISTNSNCELPDITEKFVLAVFKTVCKKDNKKGEASIKEETRELMNHLKAFYETHYKPLRTDEVTNYENMDQIMQYLCKDIVTMYENNIKQHYVEYVERFVNVFFDKKDVLQAIKNNKELSSSDKNCEISQFNKELRKVKKVILDVEHNDTEEIQLITELKKIVLPNKSSFKKNSTYYDLQCDPQPYFAVAKYIWQRSTPFRRNV